ncbi:MAG: GEVED domain-containing protein [Blastocatellia bacterium]
MSLRFILASIYQRFRWAIFLPEHCAGGRLRRSVLWLLCGLFCLVAQGTGVRRVAAYKSGAGVPLALTTKPAPAPAPRAMFALPPDAGLPECGATGFANNFVAGWFHNDGGWSTNQDAYWANPPNGPYVSSPDRNATYLSAAGAETAGGSITNNVSSPGGTISVIEGVSGPGTTLNDAYNNNNYLQYSFTTSASGTFPSHTALHQLMFGKYEFTIGFLYTFSVLLSTSPTFTTATQLVTDYNMTFSSGDASYTPLVIPTTKPVLLQAATTYYIRVYFYNASTLGAGFFWDDFQIGMAQCMDCGDAPDTGTGTGTGNYKTTYSDGGASHSIIAGLRLGTNLDADNGSLQNANADADDTNGVDDEDGIASFPSLTTVAGQTYTVSVSVTNTTGSAAYLVGYLDFNKDGDFLDTGEQSATVTVNASGSYNVSFTVPASVTTGTTYARFRLGSTLSQVTSSVGAATSGEVEDYKLTIVTAPDLTIAKSHSGSFTLSSTGTYTLTVSNGGTGATSGTITVTDTLPTGLTVNSGGSGSLTPGGTNAANWSCSSNAAAPQVITCTSSTAIAAGSASVFTFTVNVGASTAVGTNSITNSVSVSGGGEANTSNNTASDPTTVIAATLAAYKSIKLTTDADSSNSASPGDTLTYTLQYANTGSVNVTSFQVTDVLPSGLTITATGAQTVTVSGSGTSASKNASYTGAAAGAVSNLLAASASLNTGGVITITIPVTAGSSLGSKANQATGSGTGLSASVSTDNAGATTDLPGTVTAAPYSLTIPSGSVSQTITGGVDATTVTISGVPSLTLVKVVSPGGTQTPGTDLVYSNSFTNAGTGAAQQLIIVDAIPVYTDFKLNSVTTSLGTSGLTVAVEYSNDYVATSPGSATWTYTPVSGGGSAPTGYDRNVKAMRWRVTAGTLSTTSPNNTATVGFTVRLR